MLDTETKARIDSARDILVGKVPDPKSQVEQITIALIYKFMDDMDRQSEELNGKVTFFAGEFKKYRWANLLDKRLGGHERLGLYSEGLDKMNINKNIPQLFRDIFKGVFLPYRDPETLNLFLKEIAGFNYDHSERLGDAYEYLLSVLGTQGDAGQFRTPRHIIDFIVTVVDPQKNETVLDPACGTAGFLISAFKHILRSASSKPSPPPSPTGRGSGDLSQPSPMEKRGGHYRGGFDFAALKKRARELRRTQTDAEKLLWELLRDRQLGGAKFRRQHQFGDYISDFYCEDAKLVVECEGSIHDTPQRKKTDSKRDTYLRSQGLTVLRFKNDRVVNDTEIVLTEIADLLPSPLGGGDGGEGIASGDLTPDERARLMTNFRGYDIAPDMVRLSRVNLYLHGFPNPILHEYDTLTSEERWDERCDVIMANPPFMTPKGGIRPHNRFSIKAKRSEVLFVDYIAEHLNPSGRAGVIVPEGIIFQSQNAYKNLRRMLVENYLWAVVSLPAGVFNPYSGVKTSILFLDRNLAKRTNEVLFVKVENDGFDLGAQRRPIEGSDLMGALRIMDSHNKGQQTEENKMAHAVSRKRILESGDCTLSGDRYRTAVIRASGKWPMVRLGEVIRTITPPEKIQKSDFGKTGTYPIIDQSQEDIAGWTDDRAAAVSVNKPLVIFGDHTCSVKYAERPFVQGADGIKILETSNSLLPRFLFFWLQTFPIQAEGYKRHFSKLMETEIPLPPLEEQERIVAELEGYRKVIEGARQVIANYKPTIRVDSKWPRVKLGMMCSQERTIASSKAEKGLPYLGLENVESGSGRLLLESSNSQEAISTSFVFNQHHVLYGKLRPYLNKVALPDFSGRCTTELIPLLPSKKLERGFLFWLLLRPETVQFAMNGKTGARMPRADMDVLLSMEIALPNIKVQRKIVAELEAERKLVEANRELIARMEAKIRAKLSEVWGDREEPGDPAGVKK